MNELDVIREVAVPAESVPPASVRRARQALRGRMGRPPRAPLARRLAPVLAPVAACALALVVALGALSSKDRERGTGTPSLHQASPAELQRPAGKVRALRPDLPSSPPSSTTAPQGTAPGGAPSASAPASPSHAPDKQASPSAPKSGGGAAPKAPAAPPAAGAPSEGCAQPAPAPTQTQPGAPPAPSSSCDGAGASPPAAPSTQPSPKKAKP